MTARTLKLAVALAALVVGWGCGTAASHHGSHPEMGAPPSPDRGAATERPDASSHLDADDLEAAALTPAAAGDDRQPIAQLLTYSASIILAIYDVEQIQQQAVAVIEGVDGYVAERTSETLKVRVPAGSFHEAMDELAELGDVIDSAWTAQDVTEEVRELEIRLRNARELRDRLEQLLEEAETVEEALEIERELQRVTTEIEQLRAELEQLEQRVAYSTIRIEFRSAHEDELDSQQVQLPFEWLDEIGIEHLMQAPEAYR